MREQVDELVMFHPPCLRSSEEVFLTSKHLVLLLLPYLFEISGWESGDVFPSYLRFVHSWFLSMGTWDNAWVILFGRICL